MPDEHRAAVRGSVIAFNCEMESAVSLGYICFCGERVTVFRLQRSEANYLPLTVTVACPNGHSATFNTTQLGSLEWWIDERTASTDSSRAVPEKDQKKAA